ncbi:hypothetical protein GGR57DRAFT_507692 [Xylariaceae sp. FL1272]|nr:hypothetical protein GGR57DRAFT_507692 [Xylariaceae sp. FL1272]
MRRVLATSVLLTVAFVPLGAIQLKTADDEEDPTTLSLQQSLRNRRHGHRKSERDGDDGNDDDDDEEDDDDNHDGTEDGDGGDKESGNSGHGYPESTLTSTSSSILQTAVSQTTTVISSRSSTSLPASSITPLPDSSLPAAPSSTITHGGLATPITPAATTSSTSNSTPTDLVNQAGGTDSIINEPGPADDGPSPNEEAKIHRPTGASIAGGVVGGILLLLGLLFILYCVRTRRKQRDWLKREKAASTNDSDIESNSHVTVDLRNWPASSLDGARNSNEMSNHLNVSRNPISLPLPGSSSSTDRPVAPQSPLVARPEPINTHTDASRSLAGSGNIDLHHHSQVSGMPPSPGYNDPFADVYGTSSPTYSQASLHTAHTHSYTATPPGVLPVHAPITMPSLPTSAHFNSVAIPIDGPPPPQYPEAMRSPPLRCCSSHATLPPLPISPLTPPPLPISDLDAVLGTKPEPLPPPPRPEIVTPIHQLGQTSASLTEFDEAAVVDGRPPHAPLAYADEKQPIEPQEGVNRN